MSDVRPPRKGIPLLALLLCGAILGQVAAIDAADAPARIVAIGDVHGAFDSLVGSLRRLGLIDEANRWSGGNAVLIQTGDYLDRGERVRDVLELLMALQEQARGAGGRVEVLLGNHEVMNVIGETRDVNPAAYAAFAGPDAEARREAAWKAYQALAADRAAELDAANSKSAPAARDVYKPDRDAWMAAHPPGYLEYVEAFGPRGRYGRWIRQSRAVVKVGDTVFLHAGFHPEVAPRRLEDVNRQVREEMERFDRARRTLEEQRAALPFFSLQEVLDAAAATIRLAAVRLAAGQPPPPDVVALQDLGRIAEWSLLNPNGPLWFRGFATWTTEEGAPRVDALAARYGASRFVVGHSAPSSFRVTPRFSNRVFLIDTGMLDTTYVGGRASALEIRGDRMTAIYADGTVNLSDAEPVRSR